MWASPMRSSHVPSDLVANAAMQYLMLDECAKFAKEHV